MKPYAFPAETVRNNGDFRIVEERKGSLTVGFRVQRRHRRCFDVWINRGKRAFTIEDARMQRDLLMKLEEVSNPEITVFAVE